MDLLSKLAEMDDDLSLHATRILVLVFAFSEGDRGHPIEGLTKLAKLDFLLRYPVLLERALEIRKKSTKEVEIHDHEKYSVESRMVRYRFGPWDHRYREILNNLLAMGMVELQAVGRKVTISLTDVGSSVARNVISMDEFVDYHRRSKILRREFDLRGTNLMKFIYEAFPEVVSLRSNQTI